MSEEMTRAEAIDHIIGLELAVANEYYVGYAEHDEGMAETRAALRALGVTNEEMDA